MLIAGEPSGDLLAAELVNALKTGLAHEPFPPKFFGAGGAQMAAAGVELAFDLTQHAVIGLVEALKNYGKFKRLFDQLLQLACVRQPDVIVCVDFSGFNRRFAAAVRRMTRARSGPFQNWRPRLVQYVSPQVWASRPGRAYSLERDLDLLLSILPFEKEWYAKHAPQLRVEFVGHPICERFEVRSPKVKVQSLKPHLLLLPGSRAGELARHLPPMVEAGRLIQQARPETHFLMVLPNEDLKRLAAESSTRLPGLHVQIGGLGEALREATVAIASTGTVTLECAFFGVPTVAIYQTSWSTYQIGKRIITVDFLAMPNLLAGEAIFPELIQHAATGENIAHAALELLQDESRRTVVKLKLAHVITSLGGPGASGRAAKAVLGLGD